MSTSKPRITLSLQPHTYEVLRRLSAASGQPMSTSVTDFLDVAIPGMERMAAFIEAAKGMPEKTRQEIREALEKAEAELLPVLAVSLEQADTLIAGMGKLEGARGEGEARAHDARRKGGSTPVPVTRGSGRGNAAVLVPSKGGKNGRV